MTAPVCIPSSHVGVPWSPGLFSVYDIISGLFASCYSDWHEMIHHCSFVLHFLLFSDAEHLSFASCPSKWSSCPTQAQQLWSTGLVSPKHVEYSRTNHEAHVPCTVRWVLKHWVISLFFFFWDVYIYIWNITALQCCGRFCCTTSSISHKHMYTHSLLTLPPTISISPLWPSQSTELSSLCYTAASLLLPILHIVVNICQGYSLNWSPSHSPSVSTGLFSVFVKILY